jgi:hypothetical protein
MAESLGVVYDLAEPPVVMGCHHCRHTTAQRSIDHSFTEIYGTVEMDNVVLRALKHPSHGGGDTPTMSRFDPFVSW